MRILQKYPEVELYWLLNGKGSFPSITKNLDAIDTMTTSQATKIESILPSNKHLTEVASNSLINTEVDQIVIFFKDGTFKSYKN